MTTPEPAGSADTLPAPGTHIRVTHIQHPDEEPNLYPGATGRVREVGRQYMTVDWDDATIVDAALLVQADRWEATDG